MLNTAQLSLDDLGTRLFDVTFCVVDLETTGGAATDEITEIGAVLTRGGEILGEFQTLVRPRSHIPAMIQVLTGITNAMVADAPRIEAVLGQFLQFAAGAVLVAHNARFDVGFLKRACAEQGQAWPNPCVLDTVAIARSVLLREEVRNCKLSTLAAHFKAETQPNHRALSDARATVDVLHGLMERVGNLGIDTLEDLVELTRRVSPDRRAKRVWAKDVPREPGVYWFVGGEEVLYVGKSSNLNQRVRGYFSAAEQRARIHEMVRVATGLRHVVCASDLEATVRELRMIASHHPPYNRRSKRQDRLTWLKLTQEAFPRLSLVRQVRDDDAHYWGPFPGRTSADAVMLAIYDAFALRRCTTRLSASRPSPACALAELGKCAAPCTTPESPVHSAVIEAVRRTWTSDIRPLLAAISGRLNKLVEQERFEEAGEITERVKALTRTSVRFHRIKTLASCPQIVAAAPEGGAWVIHVIRYGKLAGAAKVRRPALVEETAELVVAGAETVAAPVPGLPAGSVEEAETVARWLESPGVRLLEVTGDYSWPIHAGVSEADLPVHLRGGALPCATTE